MGKLKNGDRVKFIGSPNCSDVPIGIKGTIINVWGDICNLE